MENSLACKLATQTVSELIINQKKKETELNFIVKKIHTKCIEAANRSAASMHTRYANIIELDTPSCKFLANLSDKEKITVENMVIELLKNDGFTRCMIIVNGVLMVVAQLCWEQIDPQS